MHRSVVGVISGGIVATGLALLLWSGWRPGQQAGSAGGMSLAGSALLRVGIVVAAIWLAMPERTDQIEWGKIGPRASIVILAALVVFVPSLRRVVFGRFWPIAVGLGLLIYFLRPRPKGRR